MSKDMKAKEKQKIKDKKLESIKMKKEAAVNKSLKKSLKKKDTIAKILDKKEDPNPTSPPNV